MEKGTRNALRTVQKIGLVGLANFCAMSVACGIDPFAKNEPTRIYAPNPAYSSVNDAEANLTASSRHNPNSYL